MSAFSSMHLRTVCISLFPNEYRARAHLVIYPGLPKEIWQEIHSLRDLTDLCVSRNDMETILGFGPSSTHHQAWKNSLLRGLMTNDMRVINNVPLYKSTRYENDIHLLMMSLYNTCQTETNSFPVVNITSMDTALQLVSHSWYAYCYLPEPWRSNRKLATIALYQHVKSYDFMPVALQEDREILRYTLPRRDSVYAYLSDNCRSDEEIIKLALTRSSTNYSFIPVLIFPSQMI